MLHISAHFIINTSWVFINTSWKLHVICSTPEGARKTTLKGIHLSSVHYVHVRKFYAKILILLTLQIQRLKFSHTNNFFRYLWWTDTQMQTEESTAILSSITGYLFQIGSTAVTWKSQKQLCVALSMCLALSTTEVEYMALAHATQEAVWIWELNSDLGNQQSQLTLIPQYWWPRIMESKNTSKYHYVWEQVGNNTIIDPQVLANWKCTIEFINRLRKSDLRNLRDLGSHVAPICQ